MSEVKWGEKPKHVAITDDYHLEVSGCTEVECPNIHWSVWSEETDQELEGDTDSIDQGKKLAERALAELRRIENGGRNCNGQ